MHRCSLCGGTGAVGWEGKWSHKEPCPMCVGKKYADCSACGGHFHRPIFRHKQRTAREVERDLRIERPSGPVGVVMGIMED